MCYNSKKSNDNLPESKYKMISIKSQIEIQASVFSGMYNDPLSSLIATIIWIDETYRFRYISEMLSPENALYITKSGSDIDQNKISELSEMAEFRPLTKHKDIFIDILFRTSKDDFLPNKICLAYDELTNKKGVAYRSLLSSKDDELYFNYQSTLNRKRGN